MTEYYNGFKKNLIIAIVAILGIMDLNAKSMASTENTKPWDTVNRVTYQISAGAAIFSPSSFYPIQGAGYSFDFTQMDIKISSVMHNSQGLVIRNGWYFDIKENPVTPRIDLAYLLGNFNMV